MLRLSFRTRNWMNLLEKNLASSWWCRVLSFEKLESTPSCPWVKLKRNHKIITVQLCFVTSCCHCSIEAFFFFSVGRPCTDVALCCWSLCGFSASIWCMIWCLFFPLLTYVILLLFSSKRHLYLDHSFRHMSEKVKKKRLWKVICWMFAYIPAMEGHALKSDPNRSFLLSKPLCSTNKSETHKCPCVCSRMFAYNQFRLVDAVDPLLG